MMREYIAEVFNYAAKTTARIFMTPVMLGIMTLHTLLVCYQFLFDTITGNGLLDWIERTLNKIADQFCEVR